MGIYGKFWNGYLTINSVDLSARLKSALLNNGHENIDLSCMGNGTRIGGAGIKVWSLAVEFEDDLAASGSGSVDATLQALVGADAFPIAFRLDSGAKSATNPEWSGNAVLGSPVPVGGAHGQPLRKSVTFVSAGDLTRSTS